MYQQPVVNKTNLKIGSVKVEISDDGVNYVTLGTGNKAKFAEKLTTQDITSDNGGVIDTIVKDQTCEVSFNMMEFDLNIMQQARGGIDDYSVISGSQVSGYSQVVAAGAWAFNKFIKFTNQNGDGSAITPTSVTAGTDGVLAADVDYYVGQNGNGEFGIFIVDSAKVTTENQSITIVYNYTPKAAQIIKTGGKTSILSKYVRLTNKRASDGAKFQIIVYKARNTEGISIDFPGDDEGKAWESAVKFSGSKDPNRSEGDQLFTIINEQI